MIGHDSTQSARRVILLQRVTVWPTALLLAVGGGLLLTGLVLRSNAALRWGGAVLGLGGAWPSLALLFTGRLFARPKHQVLLLVAVGAQIVQLGHHLVAWGQTSRLDMALPHVTGVGSLFLHEWVGLFWLALVSAALLIARRSGCVGWMMTAACAWTVLHTLEHLYLLVQFARLTTAVDNFGLTRPNALNGSPGILGRDGWLAIHASSMRWWAGPLLAAPRVTVHLGWAVGDVALPIVASVRCGAWKRAQAAGDAPPHRGLAAATATMSESVSPG